MVKDAKVSAILDWQVSESMLDLILHFKIDVFRGTAPSQHVWPWAILRPFGSMVSSIPSTMDPSGTCQQGIMVSGRWIQAFKRHIPGGQVISYALLFDGDWPFALYCRRPWLFAQSMYELSIRESLWDRFSNFWRPTTSDPVVCGWLNRLTARLLECWSEICCVSGVNMFCSSQFVCHRNHIRVHRFQSKCMPPSTLMVWPT